MASQIFGMFYTVFYWCAEYFKEILEATQMSGLLIGCFFIFMVVRFIIKPFVGGMTSTYSKKGVDSMKVETSKK